MIEIYRTGRVFSMTSVEFRIVFPDGSEQTIWSQPWQIDESGAEIDYRDSRQDEGARREAERIWAERVNGNRNGNTFEPVVSNES